MNLTSISTFNLCGPDTVIKRHADCIVAHTPSNPEYWWGNFTLFLGAVDQPAHFYADRARRNFEANPNIKQTAFLFDEDASHLASSLNSMGYVAEQTELLHWPIDRSPEPQPAEIVQLGPDDTERFVALSTLVNHGGANVGNYLRIRAQSELNDPYRKYFAIMKDGELIANATTILRGDWAGIDEVMTHPQYERQGHCRALLAHAIGDLQKSAPKAHIYVDTEMGSPANAIYKRFGFECAGRSLTFTNGEA